MKKIKQSKLRLNSQVIRELSADRMVVIVGGLRPDGSDRDNTCNNCDPTMPTVCPGPNP